MLLRCMAPNTFKTFRQLRRNNCRKSVQTFSSPPSGATLERNRFDRLTAGRGWARGWGVETWSCSSTKLAVARGATTDVNTETLQPRGTTPWRNTSAEVEHPRYTSQRGIIYRGTIPQRHNTSVSQPQESQHFSVTTPRSKTFEWHNPERQNTS